jgi:hypothetical protein
MDVNSTGFAVYMSYDVAPTAIIDSTFLGKRANALCYNIPIYWLQPTCSGKRELLCEPFRSIHVKLACQCFKQRKNCEPVELHNFKKNGNNNLHFSAQKFHLKLNQALQAINEILCLKHSKSFIINAPETSV